MVISQVLSFYREMGFVELQQLTKISSWCEQYIQYKCLNAPLRSVPALSTWGVNYVIGVRRGGGGNSILINFCLTDIL